MTTKMKQDNKYNIKIELNRIINLKPGFCLLPHQVFKMPNLGTFYLPLLQNMSIKPHLSFYTMHQIH